MLQPIPEAPLNLDPTTHEGQKNLRLISNRARMEALGLPDLAQQVRACAP